MEKLSNINVTISELSEKYSLDRNTVIKALESVFGYTFSKIMATKVRTSFKGNGNKLRFELEVYSKYNEFMIEVTPNMMKKNHTKLLLNRINDKLTRLDVLRRYNAVSYMMHSIVQGYIYRILDNDLYVSLPHADYLGYNNTFHAFCPLQFQPPKERSKYKVGQWLFFYISDLKATMIHEEPGLLIVLGRSNLLIVEELLKHFTYHQSQSYSGSIKCVKRISGVRNESIVSSPIPKQAIFETAKELGEFVKVRVGNVNI